MTISTHSFILYLQESLLRWTGPRHVIFGIKIRWKGVCCWEEEGGSTEGLELRTRTLASFSFATHTRLSLLPETLLFGNF